MISVNPTQVITYIAAVLSCCNPSFKESCEFHASVTITYHDAVPEINEAARDRRKNTCLLSAKHLYIILWKNVYVKRLCRHYMATLIEIALIVALLLGIQEDAITQEPLIRRGDTFYQPMHTNTYWNTQRDLAYIREVYYYAAKNQYVNRLTRDAFHRLGITAVTEVPTEQQLFRMHQQVICQNGTKPVQSVLLLYNVAANDAQPTSLHVSLIAGRLPFDVQASRVKRHRRLRHGRDARFINQPVTKSIDFR
ncbi:hypothetical protein MRX96_039073 [Rhipicephalus microplus]